MPKGLNKVQIIGNLVRDPDYRLSSKGNPYTQFTVAVGRSWRDRNTNELREETDFIRCTAFGRIAEISRDYMNKGSTCYLEGRMQTSSFERDGARHYSTTVVIQELILLGGGKRRTESSQGAEDSSTAVYAEESSVEKLPQVSTSTSDNASEEDIPF